MRVVLVCILVMAAGPMPVCSSRLSKRMPDGKRWTVRNLDVEIEGSYCYEGNCRQYGRLYTWESARRACQSLGQGWRLPTDEDWQHLAALYGAAAYRMLLSGGNSGFDALLGGGRDLNGQFARLEAHGFYWTATEDGPASAVFYNFAKGKLSLFRQSEGEKARRFECGAWPSESRGHSGVGNGVSVPGSG